MGHPQVCTAAWSAIKNQTHSCHPPWGPLSSWWHVTSPRKCFCSCQRQSFPFFCPPQNSPCPGFLYIHTLASKEARKADHFYPLGGVFSSAKQWVWGGTAAVLAPTVSPPGKSKKKDYSTITQKHAVRKSKSRKAHSRFLRRCLLLPPQLYLYVT